MLIMLTIYFGLREIAMTRERASSMGFDIAEDISPMHLFIDIAAAMACSGMACDA